VPEDCKEEVAEKLKRYKSEDIILTNHAIWRSLERDVDMEELKRDLLDPKELYAAQRLKAKGEREEKFKCFFKKSNRTTIIAVIVINLRILVITVTNRKRKLGRMVRMDAKM
jgi:hypothetical protein